MACGGPDCAPGVKRCVFPERTAVGDRGNQAGAKAREGSGAAWLSAALEIGRAGLHWKGHRTYGHNRATARTVPEAWEATQARTGEDGKGLSMGPFPTERPTAVWEPRKATKVGLRCPSHPAGGFSPCGAAAATGPGAGERQKPPRWGRPSHRGDFHCERPWGRVHRCVGSHRHGHTLCLRGRTSGPLGGPSRCRDAAWEACPP